MRSIPETGAKILRKPLPDSVWNSVQVELVRDLSGFQKVVAVRAVTFMCEQTCPYEEEFDGNDMTATHILASVDGEPVATLRVRWFAGFGKIERVCVVPGSRGTPVVKVLVAHTLELAARKGYRRMIAQIQARLWDMWSHVLHCSLRSDRSGFIFSGYEYAEVDIFLPAHPKSVSIDADPYIMIRPEGDWDRPGVLEKSIARPVKPAEAA